jgi:hypothetical protein
MGVVGVFLGAGWIGILSSVALAGDRPAAPLPTQPAIARAQTPTSDLDLVPVEQQIVGLFQEFYCAYWATGTTVEDATAQAYRDTYQFLQVKFDLGVRAGLSNAAQQERDRAIATTLNHLGDALANTTVTCPVAE